MVEKVEQLSKLEEEKEKISRLFLRRILFIVVCAALVIVVVGVSLTIGTADISFIEAYAAIFAEFFPDWFQVRELTETIVWQLRLPRILMGAMAGATLAMAGCTTQSILRNPLATPYTLGVSASAGFGAAIGFILAAGLLTGPLLIISNAFLFSLIPAGVVMIAARRMRASPETIILCGVAMAYIFTACNTLLQYFAEEEALRATVFWMVGDLARSAWWQLPYVLVVLTFLAIVGIWLSRDIGIIRMGDEDAKALGVEVERVRKVIIVIACLS
ncbi:MAG: FecCD family ABC transporter permease, partial [Methanomassiliicoccales archaeon]